MSKVHIFTAPSQPATSYVDRAMPGRAMRVRNSPRTRARCYSCGRLRWMKKLVVQCYYDGRRYFCRERERYRGDWRCKGSGKKGHP